MKNTAGNFIHLSFNRRPVLTAMMVYSVGFGAATLMAAVAVWRANSICPHLRKSEQPYVVQVSEGHGPAWKGQPGSLGVAS